MKTRDDYEVKQITQTETECAVSFVPWSDEKDQTPVPPQYGPPLTLLFDPESAGDFTIGTRVSLDVAVAVVAT